MITEYLPILQKEFEGNQDLSILHHEGVIQMRT